MESVRETQEMFTLIDTRSRLEFRQISGRGLRADAGFDIRPQPDADHHWRIGLRDIEQSRSLDLQYARSLGNGTARVGLFGGQAGGGYQFPLSPRWGLEAELYNLSNPRLDLRSRLMLRDDFGLLVGFEKAFSGSDPMVGVRYEGGF